MAQSGEQFTGGEKGPGPGENSMSLHGMNKLVASLTPEVDVKHDYQLEEMYSSNNDREKNDANLRDRLLQLDEVEGGNEDIQLEESYKRDMCHKGSSQISTRNGSNQKEQNEANQRNHVLKPDRLSPTEMQAINEEVHGGDAVYGNGDASQSTNSSFSTSCCEFQQQSQTADSHIGSSSLEEIKMCRGYDIQSDKQTNTSPQALPSTSSRTSLSINGQRLIARAPLYSHQTRRRRWQVRSK